MYSVGCARLEANTDTPWPWEATLPRRSGSKTRDTGAAKSGYLKKITWRIFSTVRSLKNIKDRSIQRKRRHFPLLSSKRSKIAAKERKVRVSVFCSTLSTGSDGQSGRLFFQISSPHIYELRLKREESRYTLKGLQMHYPTINFNLWKRPSIT